MNLADEAKKYREAGEYLLALTCAEKGACSKSHMERARALNWLGRSEEAIKAAEVSIETAISRSEKCEAWLAMSIACLGNGEYKRSLESALKATENAGENPLELGRIEMAISAAQASNGNIEKSIECAKKANLLVQNCRPRERAEALHVWADACHRAGHFTEAAGLWQGALALRRKSLDPNHPEVATTVDGMAMTLRRLGLPQLAISLHEEALKIYRKRFDPNHPALASSMHALAQVLMRLKRHKEARTYMMQSLEIAEERQGSDHPNTWISRFELGRIEIACGDFDRGTVRMEMAHARMEKLLGPDHPTIKAMNHWRKDS